MCWKEAKTSQGAMTLLQAAHGRQLCRRGGAGRGGAGRGGAGRGGAATLRRSGPHPTHPLLLPACIRQGQVMGLPCSSEQPAPGHSSHATHMLAGHQVMAH